LIFRDTIRKGLIGPGSDIFGTPDEQEIISDYPLKRYYSGILFPERETNANQLTIGEVDDQDAKVEFSDDTQDGNQLQDDNEKVTEYVDEITEQTKKKNKDLTEDYYSEATHYFPNNFGLTFCVGKEQESVVAEFSFAMYEQLKTGQGKIAISKEDFDEFVDNHFASVRQYLVYDDGFMSIIAGVSLPFNAYSLKNYFGGDDGKPIREMVGYNKLALLLGRMWRRKQIQPIELKIDLNDKDDYKLEGIPIFKEEESKNAVSCYFKRVYQTPYGKYVKILMANRATHRRDQFSNAKETLNAKCLYQIQITIKDATFKSYKQLTEANPFDEELNTINFQYKDELSFGIGHGCSVVWNNNSVPTELSTTFQPQVDIKSYSNDFRSDFPQHLKDIAELKNLSIWSRYKKDELISKLIEFVQEYNKWIKIQEKVTVDSFEESIKDNLIRNHQYTYNRLINNIKFLKTNEIAYNSFLLANTAMYLQMILSTDDKFGKKVKDLSDFSQADDIIYNSLDFFEKYTERKPVYRPFQLAFFLLNIESTINKQSEDRNKIVDLIWFPTGGGKTEAYLALTAFTIISRRKLYGENAEGVSVIMRYTLRLLTAQQFDRAEKLILSLEFLRKQLKGDHAFAFGEERVSIGMWVGSTTTANNYKNAYLNYFKYLNDGITYANQGKEIDLTNRNKFPVTSCPWCGCNLVSKNPSNNHWITGYLSKEKSFSIRCLNKACSFSDELPTYFIDEKIYEERPTLLFATVDKFAMLSHRSEGHKLFNSLDKSLQPPDLIIQDELHLLSGPLGSITGLYETIIEMLCIKGEQRPKIIASTATTRNTADQVRMLYGNRNLNIFPAPGLSYKDNFFSFVTDNGKRKHIGFFPTGKTSVDTQIQLLAHLLLARIELFRFFIDQLQIDKAIEKIDHYWTIVSFYNSLRDVGKIFNKVPAEIISLLKMLHYRYSSTLKGYNFNYYNLPARTKELTSRVQSNLIKSLLNEMEHSFGLRKSDSGNNYVSETVDLVLASNMFSVGIDIKRLNIMLMNGQPRNVAEYIQASSRVGRDSAGIVINLLDANRSREKSYFENYTAFHNSYYKYVEPLSVTPFTEIALDKVLNTIMVCYVRHKQGLSTDKDAKKFSGNIVELKDFLAQRIKDASQLQYALNKLDELSSNWLNKQIDLDLHFKNHDQANHNLIQKTSLADEWSLMQSMREIDTNSIIKIIQ
jgi:Helicase conserved C-terminal domain